MAADEILAMIGYNGGDVRRIGHALKVTGYAEAIACGEGLCGRGLEILKAAAALHDIGIHEAERRYSSAAGPYQEKEGPPVARAILEGLGHDGDFIDRVCFLVGHHHTYSAVDGEDYQILIEADFLVNLEEDGLEKGAEAVKTAVKKYFKTATGTAMAIQLFGLEQKGADAATTGETR